MTDTVLFSGIQPTGHLHIGNYFGAIRQWLDLQHKYANPIFCVVDLHAITVDYEPSAMMHNIYKTIATYVACGVDPKRAKIFIQSEVSEHLKLYWLLNCITPISWLQRMTQFKDKSKKYSNKTYVGLMNYPVLMAADILLYGPGDIPVGDDQMQHIELTCQIARAFNHRFRVNHFAMPSGLVSDSGRIMSLKDGNKKMSKSDPSDYSRINLTDSNDVIVKKIAKATTDSHTNLVDNLDKRPEIKNLVAIYSKLKNWQVPHSLEYLADKNYALFKSELSDLLISLIEPIATKVNDMMSDVSYIKQLAQQGAASLKPIARKNFDEINKIAIC